MNSAVEYWSTITRGSGFALAIVLSLIVGRAAVADDAPAGNRTVWAGGISGSPEAPPAFELQRAYSKLKFASPVDMAFQGDRVFVAEQSGKLWSFPAVANDVEKADLVVDLRNAVTNWRSVKGATGFDSLYGVAFHPRFSENHYVFLCYALSFQKRPSDPVGTRVSRFTIDEKTGRIVPGSEKQFIQWQAGGHNGGCVKFGRDGYLYVSAGDQADPNPPDLYHTGQDISDLRAGIMRIDVDHPHGDKPYSIPADNPFVKLDGARGEVWCYGLRNPWRFSFDRATGRMWVADVGWELWESIYCAAPGGNYGWSIMEGPNPIYLAGKRGPTPITPPALSLSHAESSSITGGFVYRGKRFPELVGHYVFGDWETRRVWAAKLVAGDKLEPHRTIAQSDARIVAFGEDPAGELYVVDYEGGGLFALAENPAAHEPQRFPKTLKESGLFTDVAKQQPAVGVVPFSINAPQWLDGATATRFLAVPGTRAVTWFTADVYGRPALSFPKDTVLVRTLSLEMTRGVPDSRRNIETQLLHFNGKQWMAYTYRWRDDGTDADLVGDRGDQRHLTIADASLPGGKREQTWHFQSRAQCLTCHTAWSGFTLAYNHPQLNVGDQLKTLVDAGLIPANSKPKPDAPSDAARRLVDPYDAANNISDRARSYLNVNCSPCHREGGGGSALIDLRREKTLQQTHAFNQPPMLGAFGIDDPRIIHPGDPSRSVLLYRVSKTGSGRMPHIGSDLVDDRAVALLAEWIDSLKRDSAAASKLRADQEAAVAALGNGAGTAASLEALTNSTSGGLALVAAIESGKLSPGVRQTAIERGLASSLPAVQDLFEHFTGRDTAQTAKLGLGFDRVKLLAMSGDFARGRDVFQNVAQCAACHVAPGVTGREFGPNLDHIATKYTKAQLLEQIVEPSKVIAEGFAPYSIETVDGDLLTGFVVSRSPDEIVIKDATLQLTHVPASQAKTLKPLTLSIMPAGILENLEPQQAADLLEWLATLK